MPSRGLALFLFDCMCDTEVDKSHPPEFLTRPKPLAVPEGSSAATFTCRVQGHPLPTVSWENNGRQLSSNEHYKISRDGQRHSLEIIRPQTRDSGQYMCVVQNPAGTATHGCSLIVTEISGNTAGSSSTAGAVDFRSLLKPRQSEGQLRTQRGPSADPSDKENHDFRHVLRNTARQHSSPLSTTSTTTPSTTFSLSQQTVSNGTSLRGSPAPSPAPSPLSSVSSSASLRSGGVRKNLDLFEKRASPSTDKTPAASRQSTLTTRQSTFTSALPESRPSPGKLGEQGRQAVSLDTRFSPEKQDGVKGGDVQDWRKREPVQESVVISTVQPYEAAPVVSRERARERVSKDVKAMSGASKSLDRTHWRQGELTVQPSSTDFRSVLSKPNASSEHKPSPQPSTDSKPSRLRPELSKDETKNGHDRDIKQTGSGKMDFRSVLKTRQTDEVRASSVSRDTSKPKVQSSQSEADFRSVLSRLKPGANDNKQAQSKPAQPQGTAKSTPTLNKKSLSSKDLNSLRSKFENPAQDSNSVQSKFSRTAVTTSATTIATTTTTSSGRSGADATDNATLSWRERSREILAVKAADKAPSDWRGQSEDKNTTKNVDKAMSDWREQRREKRTVKVNDSVPSDWRTDRGEKATVKVATSNWRDGSEEKTAVEVTDKTVSDWRKREGQEKATTEVVTAPEEMERNVEKVTEKVVDSTAENKPLDVISSLGDTTRFSDDLKGSDSSQLSDSAISSAFSKLSEFSDLSDSSSAVSEIETPVPRGRRRLERLKERLGGGGSGESEGTEVGEAPSIQQRLEDRRVRYGGQVKLQCKVSGVPAPDISWSVNQKTVKPSRFFQLSYQENVAQLLVAEAFSEDEGEYTCTATNSSGSDSCSCYLTVDGATSSRSSRSDSHVFEGAVSTPPRVESLMPASQTVRRGQPASFQLTYSGEPTPLVTWFRGKTPLQSGERVKIVKEVGVSTLTLPSSNASDSGRYTVTLTNDLGSDQLSTNLSVEDVPESPVGMPQVYDISRKSVSLSWCGPAFDGGSVVTHYVIEVKDANSKQWTTLTDECKSTAYHALTLKPDTSYQFRVLAANKLGLSEPSLPTPSVVMSDPLQTGVDYESDDELPFEHREVTLTPGRKFEDHYDYLNEVGKGKFGSVYKCKAKETGKIWAAKVLKVREKEKAGVRQEVEVMNKLTHPKLLMLWDAFEAPRTMVLVMEFVAAGELFERVIRDDFVLTERDCVHFLRQICNGVGYMHSQSILHLDLKPENILCVAEHSNQIKIIDFGLARFYKPGDSLQVLFGTPEFIAPEVVNYDEINYATDMWSIGVICYILLSGLSPFLGDNEAETLANVTSGEYDFDDESFDEISDKAKDFIGQLLLKRKEKRLTIAQCEKHTWLSEEDQRIRCKRLNTDRLRCFMARRKWQKTGNAIRALGRMASLQKMLVGGSTSHSSSGSLSSIPDASGGTPLASGHSTPVFSPSVHHSHSPHPLSSDAIREMDERKMETSTTTTTTSTTNGRLGDRYRDGGKAETNGESVKPKADTAIIATTASDTQSSPPSWRRGREERGGRLNPSPPPPTTTTTTIPPQPRLTKQVALTGSLDETDDSARKRTQDERAHILPQSHASATNNSNNNNNDNKTERFSPDQTSQLPADSNSGEPCAPRFLKEMVDCTAFKGDAVRFDVTVSGNPAPRLQWLLEDEEVEEDERHLVEAGENGQCSLIVRHVTEDDEGEYLCRAVNSHGEANCVADLNVYSMGSV